MNLTTNSKQMVNAIVLLNLLGENNVIALKAQLQNENNIITNIINENKKILLDDVGLTFFLNNILNNKHNNIDDYIDNFSEVIMNSQGISKSLIAKYKNIKNSIAEQNNLTADNSTTISEDMRTFLSNYTDDDVDIYTIIYGENILKNISYIYNSAITKSNMINEEINIDGNMLKKTKKMSKIISSQIIELVNIKNTINSIIEIIDNTSEITDLDNYNDDIFFNNHRTISSILDLIM